MASFIGLAAVTGGDVTIDGVKNDDLISILPTFERLGVRVEAADDTVARAARPGARNRGRPRRPHPEDRGRPVARVPVGPARRSRRTVATQARGTSSLFEKMFENRLFFVDKLVSMGARIILCDPHRAVVTGPDAARGQRMESPDIRAGMAMLLARLCAQGESTIGDVVPNRQGYERIDERLRALGARIERVPA